MQLADRTDIHAVVKMHESQNKMPGIMMKYWIPNEKTNSNKAYTAHKNENNCVTI